MERVKYNGTIKPNLATNSAARSFIVSVDPNSNNAVSWDRGYHFNDVNTVAPVHSNGLTSSRETNSNIDYFSITNAGGWNATHYNDWTLTGFANATIDPYDFHGSLYDPVHVINLVIYPGSSSSVTFNGPGYAGNASESREFFLQPAGAPGAPWAKRAFTTLPYYASNLLSPSSSNLYHHYVSPAIPKLQNLYMDKMSFPSSITSRAGATTSVSSYTVASGYTVNNVSLSPFRMQLAVINNQGSWVYCYIPLHVNSGSFFTFKKNPDDFNRYELDSRVSLNAYLDRECLRACQNYLKAGISAGSFNGSTKSYFPMLDWEPGWRFPSLPGGGTSEAPLSNSGHTSRFRITWSVHNSKTYQVSNIEQIQ